MNMGRITIAPRTEDVTCSHSLKTKRITITIAVGNVEMQSMHNIWEKISPLIRPRRFSIKRTLLEILGLVVTLQAIVVLILQLVSVIRRQNRHQGTFPHISLQEVEIGESTVQIYDYGRDLFESMLSAIDAAQESIYLETYIWKDDQLGQEFKQKLACKANQGVEVYVIF